MSILIQGCFSQPCKEVTFLRTLKIKHIAICIHVCLFYLLVAQGIESNPGPIPGAGLQAGNGVWRPESTVGSEIKIILHVQIEDVVVLELGVGQIEGRQPLIDQCRAQTVFCGAQNRVKT